MTRPLTTILLPASLNQLPIEPLHYKERFFLFTLVRDQSLPIVKVLNAWQRAAGGAEVHQDPGAGAAQERDSFQHVHLMLINILLVFLCPARHVIAMLAVRSFGAELGHDERLLVFHLPVHAINLVRQTIVPADIIRWFGCG